MRLSLLFPGAGRKKDPRGCVVGADSDGSHGKGQTAGFDHSRESRWAELGSAIGVNDCACRTASVGQGHRQRVADKPEAADRPML